VTWLQRVKAAKASANYARLDAVRAATSAAYAAAIDGELAERHAPRTALSFADAIDVICTATAWPVGHVWAKSTTGWESSGAWRDAGPEFAALKDATAATDLGSGRGIVAAVLHLESCRFMPGLEGLGGAERRAAAAALGLRAVVGVPVIRAGRVEAVLEFVTEVDIEPEGSLAESLLAIARRAQHRVTQPRVVTVPRAVALAVELPVDLAG
jgi:hypothetical protein